MTRIFALLAALLLPLAASSVAAQDSYKIKPGDVLRIEVLEDQSINRDALVLPDGRVSVPLAGTVQAGGLSVDQVRSSITSTLAPNFAAEPTVFVSLRSVAQAAPVATGPYVAPSIKVYVLGEVANPGLVEMEPGTTLMQAFALVGGFSRFAAKKRVQLRRTTSGAESIYPVNYEAILAGTSTMGATVLAGGDVIVVPQRKLFE